jgi:hypothetical protein
VGTYIETGVGTPHGSPGYTVAFKKISMDKNKPLKEVAEAIITLLG